MYLLDFHQETKLQKRVFAMAGLSFTKYVKKVCGLLVIMPILALTGCGQGDGPVSIPNTAIPPLDPPPVGFCDPINFELECPNRIASLEEFEGGPITILANEKIDANNDSAVVARMQKFQAESGATFGGGTLNLSIPFEVASGDVFTMNVWSPRPVPLQFQAGIATVDVNHGGTGWEVLTIDLGGASGSVSASRSSLIMEPMVMPASIRTTGPSISTTSRLFRRAALLQFRSIRKLVCTIRPRLRTWLQK